MAYTSSKLCHFVGRSLKCDEDRCLLLRSIIHSGILLCDPKNPNKKPCIETESNYKATRSGEIFRRTDCVCFCDIPDDSLAIHTKKYSKFGLGFTKEFIARQGARPVTYVPINHDISERASGTITPKDPKEYFDFLNRTNIGLTIILLCLNGKYGFSNLFQKMDEYQLISGQVDSTILAKFLNNETYSLIYAQLIAAISQNAFIKLFDPSLSDDSENNFYMEREWRVLDNVSFTLDDIQTIYIPEGRYEKVIRTDFPDYKNKIITL